MANILEILGAAGKGIEGYGIDRENRVKSALASRKLAGDEERDKLLNALTTAQTRQTGRETELLGAVKPTESTYAQSEFLVDDATEPTKGFASNRGGYFGPDMKPITGKVRPYEAPKEAKAPNLITVPDPKDPGRLVRAPDVVGQEVPGPSAGSGMGGAAIKKALASNTSQLAVIEDALKELDANPKAVGLMRGLPMIGDRLDPRADPAGVGARASIANIGSLKIHDRSGAAVSVKEFPRLAPFIPAINDPPEAIRIKLGKLREAIHIETEALRQQGGGAAGGRAPSVDHSKMSDEEFAKAYRAGQFRTP